jgi:outer membrane protein assembly factor BamB
MSHRILCTQLAMMAALVAALVTASADAADWPQWRGPNFDGSSPETGLPATWSRTDGIAWSVALPGPGDATPVICGDRVFVSSTDSGSGALLGMAFSVKDGQSLWKVRLGTNAEAPRNTMASPSPVSDGKVVVFLYGTGEMAGLDADGKVLWRRDLGEEFGKVAVKYGYSSSPLLYGGRLYVLMLRRPWPYRYSPGRATEAARSRGLDSFLMAMDPATGKTEWRYVRPTEAVDESFETYGTPVPLTVGGGVDLVISGGDYVTGHDPATGAERWRWGYNPRHRNLQRLIPSPTPGKGRVFVPLPRGNSLAALEPADKTARRVWERRGPTTDSATPLLYDGRLYVLDSDRKNLRVLDPATGDERGKVDLGGAVWRASPTGADGKVYCLSAEGEVAVIRAGDTPEILSRIDMGGRNVRSTIAVAGGRLYVRTSERLWCVGG